MGSFVELNDTLQITTEQGFPKELNLEKHKKKPFTAIDFKGKVFSFKDKPSPRIYHIPPTMCYLVHNIDGKWLYWGRCEVIEQTIQTKNEESKTSGKFIITQIYSHEYQLAKDKTETDPGKKYF